MPVPYFNKAKPARFASLKKGLLVLALFSAGRSAYAQRDVSEAGSSDYYVKLLGNAKDSLYASSLALYDAYIRRHPADYLTQIERCKFVERAYYGEDEEYNPKYDEWSALVDSLMADFPDVPDVLLYKSESVYGDSGIAFCRRVLKAYRKEPEKWEGKPLWVIYDKLAQFYSNDDNASEALEYAVLAKEHNDTLDNSYLIAAQYKTLGQKDNAIASLLSRLDSTNKSWELNRKGRLLLELGKADKALYAFRLAKRDSSSWLADSELAKALTENGFYEEARSYLTKALENTYGQKEALKNLFDFDLRHGDPDSALASYRRLVKDNFMADPLGIKRIKVFLRAPAHLLSLTDLLRISLIVVTLVLVLLVPYMWILPIYHTGNYFKKGGMLLPASSFRWGLRHFWAVCSLFLLTDVLSQVIFSYDALFEDAAEGESPISLQTANLTLFVFIGYLVTTLLVTRRSDLGMIWGNTWSKRKSILKGIGVVLLLRMGLGLYLIIIKQFDTPAVPDLFLSINDNIMSVNKYYHPLLGFLFVAIIGPVYEEVLFRGVILSATEKHMRFFLANFFQAFLFGAVHLDLKLFPFFFIFGLLAGNFRNKSQSLAPGISMHITNNFISFFAILAMG